MLESYGIHISAKGIILLIVTILWLAFALYLSHQDGEHTAMTSLRLAERFLGWDEGIEPDEGVRIGIISEPAKFSAVSFSRRADTWFVIFSSSGIIFFSILWHLTY